MCLKYFICMMVCVGMGRGALYFWQYSVEDLFPAQQETSDAEGPGGVRATWKFLFVCFL